ncbi:MAG: signal peptidase I [Muribaculaceae bacterium]
MEPEYVSNNTKHLSFKQRIAAVRTTRWIRFGLVAAIFVAWVIWLGSPWVLIFLPLLADIYLTQYINYGWWKECRPSLLRTVMGWVDAIVYALILVYFLFAFVGQNYQIPSSSLEKSLLVGDYLWVNKMIYGPRVPNTPIHFPLAQNTIPYINCKSYIDYPQWDYKRLKGIRNVERYDIVVFNFPAGDTVALKVQNPDYYTLVNQYGRNAVWSNKQVFGDIIYRPVDRRENYVKRCVGLPGDRLKIKNNIVYINGKALNEPENVQYNYFIQTAGGQITDELWDKVGVSVEDRNYIPVDNPDMAYGVEMLGLKVNSNGTINPIYQAPLTKQMVAELKAMPEIGNVVKVPTQEVINVFPLVHDYGWTRADMGEIWIPKKGSTLHLTEYNLPMYARAITAYEHNTLEVRDGKIVINGRETDRYTFKMDYYWMMGDNRDNSADSRYWGFVPEDHIVGSPMFVIISLDKDKGLFDGKIRTDRFFKSANTDKP